MNYDFTGKSIKCETWEQMLHLAKLAEEHGYVPFLSFNEHTFIRGDKHFTTDLMVYMNLATVSDPIAITYSDFINPPIPTETIEVTGCDGCILSTWNRYRTGVWCGLQYEDEMHPNKLFTTCPLKTKSITIKIKQNEPTGN